MSDKGALSVYIFVDLGRKSILHRYRVTIVMIQPVPNERESLVHRFNPVSSPVIKNAEQEPISGGMV